MKLCDECRESIATEAVFLEVAIRQLCERFEEDHGVEVYASYHSTIEGPQCIVDISIPLDDARENYASKAIKPHSES